MRWIGLLCALGLGAVGWSARAADPEGARVEGTIETDAGRVEILSRPVPVGRRIELPEGWYQVEEEGNDDGAVGSFSVVQAGTDGPARPAPPADASPGGERRVASVAPAPGEAAAPPPPCRAQRSAFFRELWRQSGVEVDDPGALLDGLEAGEGAATGYHWFALQVDPVRSLAWSADLRERAKELARCVNEARAAAR